MVLRREFLKWFCKITGGIFVANITPSLPPLTRINTALFADSKKAESCNPDTCTQQDNCGERDTIGHTCRQRDVCDVDASKDCTNDTCSEDRSGTCTNDTCTTDKSGECTNDKCTTDKSGECTGDTCKEDKSGGCTGDTCIADRSGACLQNDSCSSDKSGACLQNDSCSSDSSGACLNDSCSPDKSGACVNDQCTTDSSGACKNDTCTTDKSGGNWDPACSEDFTVGNQTDRCNLDKSGSCMQHDVCVVDTSGSCINDFCSQDKSGACQDDTCTSDASGGCISDKCVNDSSGACGNDRCNSDYSGSCTEKDVCVLDYKDKGCESDSGACNSDLCRDDKGPSCTLSDTCSQDKPVSMQNENERRQFMQTGLNSAIKWLYRLSSITLFMALVYGQSHAETAINNNNAVFFPTPLYKTSQDVNVKAPVGPFLRDCDGDGILEADVNGDGQCSGDPEVKDYNGDGTKELPEGTQFTGNYQFTCFYIPSDVAIISTGPLTIKVSEEAAIFGALRLNSGAEISALGVIDNRTSAWLADAGIITLITAQSGEVDETQTTYPSDGGVPPIEHISACDPQKRIPKKPTKLTARAISEDKILIGWKDNSNNEKGFKIERKNGDCSSKAKWREIAKVDENVTTYTDKELASGSDYSYQVRSYNGAGNSAYTNCDAAQTGNAGTPNVPTNLKATSLSPDRVKLTWNDTSNDEENFNIYRMAGTTTPSLLATVDANKEIYIDTTANGNGTVTSHVYYIQACNNKGCSPATNNDVVPFQPMNPTGFAVSSNEVHLRWFDLSNYDSNEKAVEIYRKEGGCASKNPWKLVISLITNRASFNDAGLNSGTTYAYRIRAYTRSQAQPYAYGYSDYSDCFEVETP